MPVLSELPSNFTCGDCTFCAAPKKSVEGRCISIESPLQWEGVSLEKTPDENLRRIAKGLGFVVPSEVPDPDELATETKKQRLLAQAEDIQEGRLDCGAAPKTWWQNLSRLFERKLPPRKSSKQA